MRRGTIGFASKQKRSESVGEKENRGGGKPGGGGRGGQIYMTKGDDEGNTKWPDDRRKMSEGWKKSVRAQ